MSKDLVKRGETLLNSRYLKFLEPVDDYSDLSFAPEEAEIIRKRLSHLSTGAFAAIPLTCPGTEGCPFSKNCPFAQISQTPKGRACLVELNLLKEWTISYIKEYDVHPDSLTDRIYVQELAEIELLLYRINSNLAKVKYGELIQNSLINVTPQGTEIYEEKVPALMELKLQLQNRKDKIVKLMVGDRQEKYKMQAALKQSETKDVSSRGASMRQELERLQRQVAIISAKEGKRGLPQDVMEEIVSSEEEK